MESQKHRENYTTLPTRHITVMSKGFARRSGIYAFFPDIHLRGKWLEEAGFKSGQAVEVVCEEGRLVITRAKEQGFENI